MALERFFLLIMYFIIRSSCYTNLLKFGKNLNPLSWMYLAVDASNNIKVLMIISQAHSKYSMPQITLYFCIDFNELCSGGFVAQFWLWKSEICIYIVNPFIEQIFESSNWLRNLCQMQASRPHFLVFAAWMVQWPITTSIFSFWKVIVLPSYPLIDATVFR